MTLDDAPLNRFHLRVTAYTTGGEFCDGYVLGMIGIALTLIVPALGLDPVWIGLIGSSALIGIFVGGVAIGPLADRAGRQRLLAVDLGVFVVGSLLQLVVQSPAELFALRLLMGVAIGAEYAIGMPLLAEFAPRRQRGTLLASMIGVWTLGYVVAFLVGDALRALGPDAWRWMLGSSAIPAAIVMLLRIGAPESPRWLVSRGRTEEALRVVRRYVHPDCGLEGLEPSAEARTDYSALFSRRYLRRTLFACLFWACQIMPYFAISTFIPEIFKALGFRDEFTSALFYNLFQLAGAIVGVAVMQLLRRRSFVIWSFAAMAVCLLFLGVWPSAPAALATIAFLVFAFVNSGSGNLESVYPSEIFPTEVRASGVGLAAAASRIGAAGGTFLLPIALAAWGTGPAMLVGAGILVLGFVVSVLWAPETRDLTLVQASGAAS